MANSKGATTTGAGGGGAATSSAHIGDPRLSPFPPLPLMLNRDRTVSAAISASLGTQNITGNEKERGQGDEKDYTEWARGRKGLSPGQAAKKMFPKPSPAKRLYRRFFIKRDLVYGREWTKEELDEAAKRGNFPHRPSDLFLKMYADVLTCLTRDPLAGNVSPSLLGTQGTIPLSIVSTIPDIMKHYYDVIVLAEKEVFLVTNYWQPSDSVNTVAAALRELNKRIGTRNGEKIVVKVMWDRGAIPQLWNNHVPVSPSTWIPLGLPDPKEVQNLSLQVVNFHRPLVGTFHQKAMVVDRKIAVLNSNNIQDRPNLEMMIHLEGHIVDSIYDNILISWNNSLSPSLPCLAAPSPYSSLAPEPFIYTFSDSNIYLAQIDVAKAAKAARILLGREDAKAKKGEQKDRLSPPEWWRRESTTTPGIGGGGGGGHHLLTWFGGSGSTTPEEDGEGGGEHGGGRFAGLVMQLVEKAREEKARLALGMAGGQGRDVSMSPSGAAGVSTVPHGQVVTSLATPGDVPTEVPASYLEGRSSVADSGVELNSKKSDKSVGDARRAAEQHEMQQLQSNGVTSQDFDTTEAKALKLDTRDPNTAPSSKDDPPGFEVADKAQGQTIKKHVPSTLSESNNVPTTPTSPTSPSKGTASSARLAALSKALNAGALTEIEAAIEDESLIDDFKPHMLHRAHKPCPIALVNRRPHGSPGHNDIRCPQDAAWLAALRYAEKNVFIQTPTLNAKPIVRGIVEACSRGGKAKEGIQVTLFLDLGFNDKGESIPFQGGTNEQVVTRLYTQLHARGKEKNLHVYWYTGKDQIRPIRAIAKSRNCHIKFLGVDGQCAILGNGNLDSQSFWHSQEANILVDNPQIVADWMDQLRTNQSTHHYGKVDDDGVWRHPQTKEELDKGEDVGCISALRAVI
ncbi:uncharacterized protein JCM6883_003679 [Sporobolomyces salmoneus]|uniref:uncharacterized protein n=1 Tax=Sporobolomyces salmoneus TaxID=183962 RepID=UPI003174C1E2